MTKKQKSVEKIKYGLVTERSEGQLYIMKPDPERKGWAVEVAAYLGGPKDDPNSWALPRGIGEKYMVLLDDVDMSCSGFLEKLVTQIKANERKAAGVGK